MMAGCAPLSRPTGLLILQDKDGSAMLSKKALLQKLIGKNVHIRIDDDVTIFDPIEGDQRCHMISEVGSDVFAFVCKPIDNRPEPQVPQYVSIDRVKHFKTRQL